MRVFMCLMAIVIINKYNLLKSDELMARVGLASSIIVAMVQDIKEVTK